ncbi:MAG: sigma 54-interacting transcriptional regulator [Firmicutes bacterium]|nr:sigma 54-interacting transcriptional regulator [Bacillota bacterium]
MKKVIVFFYQVDSREAVEFIVNDLRQAFDDLVDFPVIYLDDFSWEESLQADAYLIYSSRMRSLLRNRVDDDAKMLPMKLVPHLRAAGLAATIPDGSDVLIVNDNFASSVETAHQFYDYGISELALIPYDPDQLASGAYDHIDTAITASELHRVPPHITKVVDIGHRLVAISTIMQLIQLLDLDTERIQRNFFRRASVLMERSETYIDIYKAYYLKSEMLRQIDGPGQAASILVDDHLNPRYANARALSLFGVSDLNELQLTSYVDLELLTNDSPEECLMQINGQAVRFDWSTIHILDDVIGYRFLEKADSLPAPRSPRQSSGHVARYRFRDIIYRSEKMDRVIAMAKRIAKTDETVLIRGESGTGKELIAQSIHNSSARSDMPFVAVNCASLPESLLESELFGYEPGAFTGARSKGKTGLFEQANKGTIFLDEIGVVSPRLQAELLRTIQEMQIMKIGGDRVIDIDVRVITATNQDLEAAIKEGTFRRDLFYRINVLPLRLPPLREHKDDILPLLKHFLGPVYRGVKSREKALLMDHDWPGNVRELRNVALYYNSLQQLPEYLLEAKPAVPLTEAEVPTETMPATPAVRVPMLSVHNSGVKYDEATLKIHILSIIYRYTEPAHGLGRTQIVQMLKNSGLNVSDGKLRLLLADLAENGLVEIGRGRYGTRITDRGSDYLQERDSLL